MNEELKKVMKLRNVAFRWERFIREKESTELWTKEEFLLFLENEDAILNCSIGFDGEKMYFFRDGGSPELKEKYKQKLDRLKEIYNERFKEIEPEDHTKFSLPELFALLGKLGLTDSPIYKGLSETGKGYLIAKLLQTHIDNGKKIKNGTYPTKQPVDEQKIDAFLNKYIKG